MSSSDLDNITDALLSLSQSQRTSVLSLLESTGKVDILNQLPLSLRYKILYYYFTPQELCRLRLGKLFGSSCP